MKLRNFFRKIYKSEIDNFSSCNFNRYKNLTKKDVKDIEKYIEEKFKYHPKTHENKK